jgi:hypothetical protein
MPQALAWKSHDADVDGLHLVQEGPSLRTYRSKLDSFVGMKGIVEEMNATRFV